MVHQLEGSKKQRSEILNEGTYLLGRIGTLYYRKVSPFTDNKYVYDTTYEDTPSQNITTVAFWPQSNNFTREDIAEALQATVQKFPNILTGDVLVIASKPGSQMGYPPAWLEDYGVTSSGATKKVEKEEESEECKNLRTITVQNRKNTLANILGQLHAPGGQEKLGFLRGDFCGQYPRLRRLATSKGCDQVRRMLDTIADRLSTPDMKCGEIGPKYYKSLLQTGKFGLKQKLRDIFRRYRADPENFDLEKALPPGMDINKAWDYLQHECVGFKEWLNLIEEVSC